ncbi:unnamed protein product [Phytomonas sp. Hart1]|nr:unnamed protein product [Phytomonas sp. Hart1]|eukprot:CCW67747.1 unnamed protein product [Phytomonas sp. isolate Hart1]
MRSTQGEGSSRSWDEWARDVNPLRLQCIGMHPLLGLVPHPTSGTQSLSCCRAEVESLKAECENYDRGCHHVTVVGEALSQFNTLSTHQPRHKRTMFMKLSISENKKNSNRM